MSYTRRKIVLLLSLIGLCGCEPTTTIIDKQVSNGRIVATLKGGELVDTVRIWVVEIDGHEYIVAQTEGGLTICPKVLK